MYKGIKSLMGYLFLYLDNIEVFLLKDDRIIMLYLSSHVLHVLLPPTHILLSAVYKTCSNFVILVKISYSQGRRGI